MRIDNISIDINKSDFEVKKNNNDINFLSQLTKANKINYKKEMNTHLDNIKNLGNRLSITKNYNDVIRYKNAIKDYLKDIIKGAYDMKKSKSFWEEKYFNTVDTLNKKLVEISEKVLKEENENISIVSEIDLIQGLLIDLYI